MGIILVLGLLFTGTTYVDKNKEFFDTASEQLDRGYTWDYVGYTEDDDSVPSLPLQVNPFKPYYLFQLKKGK